MTLTNFGDNFEIEEDSNGDYVVTYLPTDTVIERIDSGNAEKIFEVGTRISDLVDNTSGNTVYDSSTETIGDGNQDVSVKSVDAAAQLSLPSYADNTNAVQDNESLWYNDGTGTDDSGYYAYDGGVIGPFGEGGGAFTDEDGDGRYTLPNASDDIAVDNAEVESVTGAGGTTVYDDATQTVGDGTTSANHEFVNAGNLTTSAGSEVSFVKPQSSPDGSEVVFTSPAGDVGMAMIIGDGQGGDLATFSLTGTDNADGKLEIADEGSQLALILDKNTGDVVARDASGSEFTLTQ